uniref:Uncharacterized protein n=1 Tax=Pelusios castaneus TaxID=367368 RepID=A0A8C8SRD0_9SAUR
MRTRKIVKALKIALRRKRRRKRMMIKHNSAEALRTLNLISLSEGQTKVL